MGRRPLEGRGAPPWLRLLVLLCVLFGVAAMHTLGHLESHGHHGAPPVAAADQAHPDAAAGHASSPGHSSPGSSPGGDGTPLPPLDPASVSLALGAVFTALLATAAAL